MVIFSLCLLLFINAMSIGLVFPIFAPLFTQAQTPLFGPTATLGIQSFYYSLILATPTFCMLFGAPFWGRLSDRIGRKSVLVIGLSGIAVSFALSAAGIVISSLALLFFSRALAGFMDGSEAIAQAAMVDLSTPETKARYMGFATFAGTIGFIIGPIVGGLLAEPQLTGRFHFELPFVVSLVLTVVNALAIYRFLPKQPKSNQPMPTNSFAQMFLKGFSLCWDKRIRWYSLLLFILQWCLASYFQLSTLVLAEKFNYSSGEIGLFTTVIGACFSAGIFLVIHVLLARLKYLSLLRGGVSLIILAILSAMYLQHSSLSAWVSVVPMMLGIAMMYNVLLVLVSNAVSEHEQGEAMGSGTSLKALGWLVSAVMIGSLYPHLTVILAILLTVTVGALISTCWIIPQQTTRTEEISNR